MGTEMESLYHYHLYHYRGRLEAKVLEICKMNLQCMMIRVYLGEKSWKGKWDIYGMIEQ